MRIEVLIDVKTILGEGPLWDVEEQRLYFIDSFGCNVFRCTADGREVRAWDVPAKIGSMALRTRGGAVLSLATGFHFLDFKTGETELIVDPEADKPKNRINDGKVDKRGRFIAGSMDTMEEGPNGALYRLDPDHSLHKLDEHIIVSNGPCWSPDGRIFYFADSWSGEIWAYDYDLNTGAVSNKRTFAKIDRSRGGAADGSTVDAEGCLWNAQVYDGKIVRYAPDRFDPHTVHHATEIGASLDTITQAGRVRAVGNLLSCNGAIGRSFASRTTAVKTYLHPGARPLGRVLVGHGNNSQDDWEGCIKGNLVGTYLHGPLLPKNPHFADYLVAVALRRHDDRAVLEPLDDRAEHATHERTVTSTLRAPPSRGRDVWPRARAAACPGRELLWPKAGGPSSDLHENGWPLRRPIASPRSVTADWFPVLAGPLSCHSVCWAGVELHTGAAGPPGAPVLGSQAR